MSVFAVNTAVVCVRDGPSGDARCPMLGDGVAAMFLAGCFVRTRPRLAPGRRPSGRRSGRASRKRRRRKPREPRPWSSVVHYGVKLDFQSVDSPESFAMRRRCGEDCDRVKPVSKSKLLGFGLWLLLGQRAAKIVIAAARAHRDITFSRHTVPPALALATSRAKHAIAALRRQSLRLAHRCRLRYWACCRAILSSC